MNNRIIAAVAFGSALILATYTLSGFGKAKTAPDPQKEVVTATAPVREYIPTTDSNNDGIPDWQDVLVNTTPLYMATDTGSSTYQTPTTLTDQLAVSFFEEYLRNKSFGNFGQTPDELVAKANENLKLETSDTLYTISDCLVTQDNSVASVKTYGNSMANILLGLPKRDDSYNEITILNQALSTNDETELSKLALVVDDYTTVRDGFLNIAAPAAMIKEHLDYINSVNAVLSDIRAMQNTFTDPLLSLMRLRRYNDDAKGLYTATLNWQNKIAELGVTYAANEPAAQVMIKQ